MKKGEIRDTQLANLIASELDYILSSAHDPRLTDLTITTVEARPGGGHFIVYVAPQDGAFRFSSSSEMKAVFKRASGFLRSELTGVLNLKRVPDLTFMPDPIYSYAWSK